MSNGEPGDVPDNQSLSQNDIEGAVRVFKSLEQLMGRPRLLKDVSPEPAQLVALAERLYALRKSRVQIFEPDIFGEPGWDILLALYIAHGRYRLKIGSVCNESNVPDTTAIRWIDTLVACGLVSKELNHLDTRSKHADLTPEGLEKMNRFLELAWSKYFPFD